MFSALDLLRLFAAFAAVFLIVPRVVFGRNVARGFVHAAFLLQVAAMVLGDWKFYLPGAAAALYLVWCLSAALMIRRKEKFAPSESIARLIRWVEERPAMLKAPVAAVRRVFDSPVVAAIAFIAAAIALRGAWFALHHFRLLRLESYSRAISLHTLMRGELWDHDGSVALLAPLAWLSGLAPDHVIRFSGALVGASLIVAIAFAGWRLAGTAAGAVWSAAIFAGLLIGLNVAPMEPAGAEWSAVFVIVAVGLARESWGAAALSLITAALIHVGLSPILLLAALALTLASMLPAVAGRVPALAALAVVLLTILTPPRNAAPEHQYEAAARVAHRIADEFRTNDWIVVSPGLEVAQTYGRGWHVELADFVNAHSAGEVAEPDFKFAYSAQSVFVFVEKRVLNQPAFSFVHDAGATPYYYNTQLGRASLEFRAARLMAAYTGAHRDATVYYEDDDLIVYRIEPAALSARAQLQ